MAGLGHSRSFLVACALLVATAGAGAALAQQPVDLEIVLAADGSGSIDETELRLQREGYAAAITDPRVLSAMTSGILRVTAIALVEWGGPGSQHTVADWTLIQDEASARDFAQRLLAAPRLARGYNSISGAIDYAAGLIRNNAYEGTRKVIDVSGDGPQIGGRPLSAARFDALAEGITINALVVKSAGGGYPGPFGEPLEEHYERDVIGGPGAFVMVADETRSFADAILNKLIREIAAR